MAIPKFDGCVKSPSVRLRRRAFYAATPLATFYEIINFDDLVKSRNSIEYVIPAKAGIQLFQGVLDPGFRRGDDPKDFLRDHQV